MKRPPIVIILTLGILFGISLILGGCEGKITGGFTESVRVDTKVSSPLTILEGGFFTLDVNLGFHGSVIKYWKDSMPSEIFPAYMEMEGTGWEVQTPSGATNLECKKTDKGNTKCKFDITLSALGVKTKEDAIQPKDAQGLLVIPIRAPIISDPKHECYSNPCQVTFGFDLKGVLIEASADGNDFHVKFKESEVQHNVGSTRIFPLRVFTEGLDNNPYGKQGSPLSHSFQVGGVLNPSDLVNLYVGIAYDPKQFEETTIDFPYGTEITDKTFYHANFDDCSGADCEPMVQGITRDSKEYVMNAYASAEENADCDSTVSDLRVPENGLCWKFYELSGPRLASDAKTGKVNDRVNLFANLEVSLTPKDSASSNVYYIFGVGSNVPKFKTVADKTSSSGISPPILWLPHLTQKVSADSQSYAALCAASTLPYDMHMGEKRTVSLSLENPKGHGTWKKSATGAKTGLKLLSTPTGWTVDKNYIELDAEIKGGDDPKKFEFTLTAPKKIGTGIFDHVLEIGGINWPEFCKSRIHVTDQVVPGWRVAHAGNGFGTIAGDIEKQADTLLLSKGAKIVSDPITVPETGKYKMRVKAGCDASIKTVSYSSGKYGSSVGTHSSATKANGILSRTTSLTKGAQVGIVIEAPSGPTKCSIDDAGLYLVEQGTTKHTPKETFTDDLSGKGCCPKNQCWDADKCVKEDTISSINSNYGCKAGVWKKTIPRTGPFGVKKGACLESSECYKDTTDKCVKSGYYFTDDKGFDHYCQNGAWGSRTKQLFTQLVTMGAKISPNDFSVSCGEPYQVINDMAADLFSGSTTYSLEQTLVCDEDNAANNKASCKNANNFCVLQGKNLRVIGTTLVEDTKTTSPIINKVYSTGTGGSPLYAFGKSPDHCKNVPATGAGGRLVKCKDATAFYEPITKTLLMSPNAISSTGQSFIDLRAVPPSSSITSVQRSAFQSFTKTLDSYSKLAGSYNNLYDFVKDLNHFDRAYYAKKGSKEIFGTWDSYARTLPSGSAGEATSALLVRYKGFSENVCEFVDIPSGLPECNMIRKDASSGKNCCFKKGSNEYYVISQGAQSKTYPLAQAPLTLPALKKKTNNLAMFMFFPDLTWKLRLQ